MEIEVIFFGNLRDAAGARKEVVILDDGARLADLIARLAEVHGAAFCDRVSQTQGLRILVDGRDSDILAGMNTQLRDGGVVVFLPPVAGG